MEDQLTLAIRLRQDGRVEESRDLLLKLVAAHPDDPVVNYQCAWSHDTMGLERAAVPFYERAIAHGLAGADLAGALLGLGSTYRCLGQYQLAIDTLRRGIAEFPNDRSFEVFLAMALYNAGQHAEVTERLLRALAETSADDSIRRYQRAILFYADKLDQTWP
ncbi:MAG: tetratricopeptide repeat protein [Roseiflexaceae bacterium]